MIGAALDLSQDLNEFLTVYAACAATFAIGMLTVRR